MVNQKQNVTYWGHSCRAKCKRLIFFFLITTLFLRSCPRNHFVLITTRGYFFFIFWFYNLIQNVFAEITYTILNYKPRPPPPFHPLPPPNRTVTRPYFIIVWRLKRMVKFLSRRMKHLVDPAHRHATAAIINNKPPDSQVCSMSVSNKFKQLFGKKKHSIASEYRIENGVTCRLNEPSGREKKKTIKNIAFRVVIL